MKILITGGTKGLGWATARFFAERESTAGRSLTLLLGYRGDAPQAEKAVAGLQAYAGVECRGFAADLSEDAGISRFFDWAERESGGKLDVYVHNAAATAFKPLAELQAHHIDRTFNLTVKSFVLGVQRVARLMPKGGAIVAVSGMDTLRAVPRHGLLGAAKSALETLVLYWAHELAGAGIRVNAVNPGFFDTESTRKYLGPAFDQVQAAAIRATPARRAPEIAEIARVIGFLASADSSWICGQTIRVDGGQNQSLGSGF